MREGTPYSDAACGSVDVGLGVPRESGDPRLALTTLLQFLGRDSQFAVDVAEELVVGARRSGELFLVGSDDFDA